MGFLIKWVYCTHFWTCSEYLLYMKTPSNIVCILLPITALNGEEINFPGESKRIATNIEIGIILIHVTICPWHAWQCILLLHPVIIEIDKPKMIQIIFQHYASIERYPLSCKFLLISCFDFVGQILVILRTPGFPTSPPLYNCLAMHYFDKPMKNWRKKQTDF